MSDTRPSSRRSLWIAGAFLLSLLVAVGGWSLWPRSKPTAQTLAPLDSLDDRALAAPVDPASLTGQLSLALNTPGPHIPETLLGLSLEEINHSLDGGLYAELIQNRDFSEQSNSIMLIDNKPFRFPAAWSPLNPRTATLTLDASAPPASGSPVTLRVDIPGKSPGRAGVANEGFWGIPVHPNWHYHASLYARGTTPSPLTLTLTLESTDGTQTFASATTPSLTTSWQRYTLDLLAAPSATPSLTNRFVISTTSPGTFWLADVSLFPPTFHDRPNGNRIDLMQKLADLHPAFLVFPGGDTLGGPSLPSRFNWKNTIGPVENRRAQYATWHRTSNGFGLLEFLQTCEDLHAQPILALFSGTSIRGSIAPGPALEPYVQDALDEIQYVTGDPSTPWGARRAADGHPAPFPLHYVRLGNNEQIYNAATYDERFTQFHDAIKQKYPALNIIGWMNLATTRSPDVQHESFYNTAHDLLADSNRFDSYPRTGPTFETEFNAKEGDPTKTLKAALADFSFLLGVQRNADAVLMAAPAPVFINVSGGAAQHPAALIGYNALNSFASPSCYALQLFNDNKGTTAIPFKLTAPALARTGPATPHGAVGVGAWGSDVEYKDIQVTQDDGTVLFHSDFSHGTTGLRLGAGTWSIHDGALRQSSDVIGCTAEMGDPAWTSYKLTLKARKLAGNEGFLIMVHAADEGNFVWWNLGGWNNTRTAVEQTLDGGKIPLSDLLPNRIDPDHWYDIEVDVQGNQILCTLDGSPLLTATEKSPKPPTSPLFAAASRDDATGDLLLKVANVTPQTILLRISLDGAPALASTADLTLLSGQPGDVNTLTSPEKIAPRHTTLHLPGSPFTHAFPPNSASLLRLHPQQNPSPPK